MQFNKRFNRNTSPDIDSFLNLSGKIDPIINGYLLMQKESIMKIVMTIFLISLALFATDPVLAETFLGVNYTVIEKTNLQNIKGSIDIRLEKKVPKDFLQKLALKLRETELRKYDRLFITYYLPGMKPGSGAWATSHFNPNLEVKILGTTIEEEKALKDRPKDSSDEIIGEWLDESPYVGVKYTLMKKNGKIIMVRKFKDGTGSENEMIQKKHSGRLRFEEKDGNDFGEYYLIERNGNLGAYDSAGLITTIRAIQ